jgi:hypothetical protein
MDIIVEIFAGLAARTNDKTLKETIDTAMHQVTAIYLNATTSSNMSSTSWAMLTDRLAPIEFEISSN